MPAIQHGYAQVNGVRLHYAEAGRGEPILFVHGFPEFWYAWKDQLQAFGRDHRAVALDMRGYNLSSKPESLDGYRLPRLAEDLYAFSEYLGDPVTLVGHDWGGVAAWVFAMMHPERVRRLVIINAPHPAIFRRELADNPAQQRASQYMALFRSPEAEAVLSADNHAALVDRVMGDGLRRGYLTKADRDAYLEAWSRPGALTGGLNWYRANQVGPLLPGQSADPAPEMALRVIEVPTLVIWGMQDTALLPGNLDGLDEWVTDLTIERVADADHWIVHQKGDQVNALIRGFLAR
ncbi:MAG: soluble epoxide hydrolase [Gemmatimonadetes bacterium]|nr:soluble epoxide hydrolase [Gemmatimonadota bacterium]